MLGNRFIRSGAALLVGATAVVFQPSQPAHAVIDPVIAIGADHICASFVPPSGGGPHCWGSNEFGQLGTATNAGTTTPIPSPHLTAHPTNTQVEAIATGDHHGCLLHDANATPTSFEVTCWGSNEFGQLGTATNAGTTTPNPTPTLVAGVETGLNDLAAGRVHTCAPNEDTITPNTDRVTCWGSNEFGQLGTTTNAGTTTPNPAPVDVDVAPNSVVLADIDAGDHHTCAVADSAAWCWGRNHHNQLGTGTANTTPNPTPSLVPTAPGIVRTVAAGRAHTCALVDTFVQCWGSNEHGQLGRPAGYTNPASAEPPAQIPAPLAAALEVYAGGDTSCAIVDAAVDEVWCWGQLADGTTTPTPTQLTGFSGEPIHIGIGLNQICVMTTNGALELHCVGNNIAGQLGIGVSGPATTTFTRTGPTPPPPTGTAAGPASETVELNWTVDPLGSSFGPITGYQIESSTDNGATWTLDVSDTGTTATTATLNGYTDGTPTLFRVSAINTTGISAGLIIGPITPWPEPDVTVGLGPNQPRNTNTAPITFAVDFDQPITGFDNTDPIITPPSGSAISSVTVTQLTPANYLVTIDGTFTDGTLNFNVGPGAVLNENGLTNPNSAAPDFVIIDTDPPAGTLTLGPSQDPAPDTTADPVEFQLTTDEDVVDLDHTDFTITGTANTPTVGGGPQVFTITVAPDSNGTITITYTGNATDPASNPLTVTGTPSVDVLDVDPNDPSPRNNEPPTVSALTTIGATPGETIILTASVTDPDALAGTITVTIAPTIGTITLNPAGTATTATNSDGSTTLTGTLDDINNTLDVVRYTVPNTDTAGTITWTVNDNGNTGGPAEQATTTSNVTVAEPIDDIAPTISGSDQTIALPAGDRGPVNYLPATATDDIDRTVAVTCTPPPGATFTVGSHRITCTASDAAGNTATTTFTLTVTTPPRLPSTGNNPVGPLLAIAAIAAITGAALTGSSRLRRRSDR